ncbi:MAG: TetR/AcrR family transcriptional regulator [Clostridia bacterium]|nr:TetR/AcrR family transcriptional regulator [Clostridia bacterium]
MILTGREDLRVIKTIEGIKTAFEQLICEKDYEKITVKELCELARINKKTFYTYYETLDALLSEMQEELSAGFLERIIEYSLPDELDKVNREFFLYAAEQGPAYEKITCGGSYRYIRDKMTDRVNDEGWGRSNKYRQLSEFEKKLLIGFINESVLNAYRQWVEGGKRVPMEDVIEMTNRIVLGGVKGFFK